MTIKQLYYVLKKPVCWLLLFLLLPLLGAAQQAAQLPPQKTRLLFVLDASGSMLAPWEEGTRMDAAKKLLAFMVDSLRVNPQVELGLRVYGHNSPRQKNDCQDSKLEVPLAAKNHDAIISTLQSLQPKGNTPLAYSLEQAAKDFPSSQQYRNILILITDGIESCGGDPCAVSLALQKKNVFLRPFVIALGEEAGMKQQFECLGDYYDATSFARFKDALNLALQQSLGKTTLSIQLLDAAGQPTGSNRNILITNAATGAPMYNFVHYRDKNNKVDTLMIDPVPVYNILVNTIPAVGLQGIQLKGGQHNELRIKAPEGSLRLQQPNHKEYLQGVKALVRIANQNGTLHVQPMATEQLYLMGTYNIEVLTQPRQYFNNVKIEGGQTTTLDVAAPGVLNVRSDVPSWRDLYLVQEDNQQALILQLDDKNSINSLALQPGNYRLVYRAKNAQSSKFTQIKDFTIQSGKTVTLNLFGR